MLASISPYYRNLSTQSIAVVEYTRCNTCTRPRIALAQSQDCIAQFRDRMRNLEIAAHYKDSENALRNSKIAQIPR